MNVTSAMDSGSRVAFAEDDRDDDGKNSSKKKMTANAAKDKGTSRRRRKSAPSSTSTSDESVDDLALVLNEIEGSERQKAIDRARARVQEMKEDEKKMKVLCDENNDLIEFTVPQEPVCGAPLMFFFRREEEREFERKSVGSRGFDDCFCERLG